MLEHDGGFLRVLGGPGTGKTTLLAEAAADRIRGGAPPESVLVLTTSRDAALRMRSLIARLVTDSAEVHTAREKLVRTVHSYAFGVLSSQAARDDLPRPTLLSGPEKDARVRDQHKDELEAGIGDWPEALRPALAAEGFVDELRDMLIRAKKHGLSPERLIELGRSHGRPEWMAAGEFQLREEQGALLEHSSAWDAEEMVSAALRAFDTDSALLTAERERVRHVLVDDAQDLDLQQYELCCRLGSTSAEFLLFGDPDQAVSSFRGADPRCLLESDPDGDRTTVLTTDHRMPSAIRTGVRRLVDRLPGSGPQRELTGAETEPGSLRVRVLASPAQEAAWVADQLRRSHLIDGVAWSEMAVLVRSTGLSLPVLRRALLAAGVPLALPADDVPLAQRGAVRPLLTLLRCAVRPEALDADAADELLRSPLGGADPLALRRLRRGLRRLEAAEGGERGSGDLLVEVLLHRDRLAALEDGAAEPARRVAELLRLGAEAGHRGVEHTLWQVWKACGLERQWLSRTERGGLSGAQADRDLDAVVALFEAAAQYAERHPGADAAAFADWLDGQQISGSSLAPTAPAGEAVEVLTAHAAGGRQWEVVAIPGVQEGTWPDLRQRGSLLGSEHLVDVLSGVEETDRVSATAPLLAEERRLLLVATSRARSEVLVSAVRGEDDRPSRFLDELEGVAHDPESVQRPLLQPQRGLSLPELVGELRQVVCDAEAAPGRRERAAAQLARLAAENVPGAHPDSWYGLPEPSTAEPLLEAGEPARISPSTVEVLTSCPLRWMLERHGGQDAAELASVTGTLVHALVQQAAEGADAEQLRKELDTAWESVDAGAPWFSRKERKRVEGMLEAFLTWLDSSRGELTQLGVERDLDLKIPARDEDGPWLRLRGRVDRLESDAQGRPVVIDVKTAKTPVTKDEAQQHPQLAVYQLAAALGAFGGEEGGEPGGARLLYVAKPEARSGAAVERDQPRLDEERVRVWLDVVHDAAASSTGPSFLAQQNSDCSRCPARTSCPVHSSGRQVGQ